MVHRVQQQVERWVAHPRPCTFNAAKLSAAKKKPGGSAMTAALIRGSCARGSARNSFLRICSQTAAAAADRHAGAIMQYWCPH
jgi:hypothetical protein